MTDKDDMTAPDPDKVDAMKLSLMLTDLRLPTISQLCGRASPGGPTRRDGPRPASSQP